MQAGAAGNPVAKAALTTGALAAGWGCPGAGVHPAAAERAPLLLDDCPRAMLMFT